MKINIEGRTLDGFVEGILENGGKVDSIKVFNNIYLLENDIIILISPKNHHALQKFTEHKLVISESEEK